MQLWRAFRFKSLRGMKGQLYLGGCVIERVFRLGYRARTDVSPTKSNTNSIRSTLINKKLNKTMPDRAVTQ